MCSVGDDDNDGEKYMEEVPPVYLLNEICKKCKEKKATVILRKRDNYCDECFLAGVTHKFRSTFGKSRLIKPGDKVMIVHSGDVNSFVLTHLTLQGINEKAHKKLQFQPCVLYIDDGVLTNITIEERQEIKSKIESQAKLQDLPFHSICITQIMTKNIDLSNDSTVELNLESQMKALISCMKTQTACQDLLKKLKRDLLIRCSKILDCSHVLLAETATELASQLLTNISLGSGPHISSDIGFSDTRDEEVKILRPLKDFTVEDIILYNKMHNSSFISKNKSINNNDQYASIQSLTEHFINNLQINFPATVSTVLKTGDKIENISLKTYDEDQQCVLCQSRLDKEITVCSSEEATLFSKETSNEISLSDNLVNQGQSCSNCSCGSADIKSLTREDINLFMCYSCRLIIKDIKNVDFLPPTLLTNIKNKKRNQKIKNSIQDFLL